MPREQLVSIFGPKDLWPETKPIDKDPVGRAGAAAAFMVR
jgi:hypothetical protein